MPGPRYVRLVSMLPAYGGAVAQALAHEAVPPPDPHLLPVPTSAPGRQEPTPITPAVAALGPHADLFDFATSGGDGA